jgi:opacity protein-like surface antigen
MRLNRGLLPGLASLALLPALAQAQPGSNFNNSWFWGVNGGMLTYWTTNVAHAQAPSVGVEWLITKKHIGLYIGFDQAFFKTSNVQFQNVGLQFTDSTLNQSTAGNREFTQTASIHDSRHIDLAFLGFPGSGPIRPYAGVGIAVNFVQNATIVGAYPNSDGVPTDNPEFWYPNYYQNQYLDQSAYWVSPLLMAGLQIQVSRISIFGQAKVYTTDGRHLFSDGAFFNVQAGVRYNVATIF